MKRNIIRGIIALIFIAIIIWAYFYFKNKNSASGALIEAKLGAVSEEVIVTGKTKSAEETSLGFEVSGKVKTASVSVGDKVYVGELLASIQDAELVSNLNDVKANLDGEKAKLEETRKGKRPEEIKIEEVKVDNAKTSLSEASRNLVDRFNDGYTKTEDAIRSKVDQFMSNSRTVSPSLNISVPEFQLKNDIETERSSMERDLSSWAEELSNLNELNDFSISETSVKVKTHLTLAKNFLAKVSLAVNQLRVNSSITQTTIDGYKTDISTARTNVNTAITNLSSAEEKWKTAKSTLTLEENQLILDKAGSTREAIASEEAKVRSAEAQVQSANAKLQKAYLRSPITGVVTKQDAKVGEIVLAGTNIVSIISFSKFEIEANVPEVDIGKISIGNHVRVSFDAFSGENFTGKVSSIEPAETVVDGITNFKVTVSIEGKTEKIKSGLTANLNIETRKKENVLVLPQYAILEKDNGAFVRKSVNGKTEEAQVILGLRGSDGIVEIISGLSSGEKVLNIGLKSK